MACSESASDPDPSAGPRANSDAVYMAATRIWDDTTTTSYFHLLPSIEEGTQVDTKRALEVPGAAKLFAVPDLGWFAIGDGESPTITRYTLDDDGELKKGASISLQPYGVESLWDTLYIVSKTKAYYPDTDQSQLIVWNPSKMVIEGTVPLPETVREGFLSYYGLTPIKRGKQLLFSVGWFDWLESDTIIGETGLVVLDTETDSVERYDVDDRCGGITQSIELSSGDAYFVSSAMAAAAHQLDRLPTKPCALRISADETAFDADYLADLTSLTGGKLSGEPVPGADDTFYLRAFDEEQAEIDDEAQTWDLTGQTVWQWWQFDPEAQSASRVDELESSTADAFWFRVDGKVFGSQTTSDYSETKLVELTAEGGPKTAISVPGFLQGIARIR